jgi:hypothetical protein
MDVLFVDDDGTYDDLGDYSKGSFLYGGEIYMRINATDKEIVKGLQKLHDNHPDIEVKMKALNTCIIHLMRIISKKYC